MIAMTRKPANTGTSAQMIGEHTTEKLPVQAGVPASPQGRVYIRDSADRIVSTMMANLTNYELARWMVIGWADPRAAARLLLATPAQGYPHPQRAVGPTK